MHNINFFESRVDVHITINSQSDITLTHNNRVLRQGSRENCMAYIRQLVSWLDSLGGREVAFDVTDESASGTDACVTKQYFKSHLLRLNSGSRSTITLIGFLDYMA